MPYGRLQRRGGQKMVPSGRLQRRHELLVVYIELDGPIQTITTERDGPRTVCTQWFLPLESMVYIPSGFAII